MPLWWSWTIWSHPTRGAWIEMGSKQRTQGGVSCRTPHGVRGLKFPVTGNKGRAQRSHPTRGAWIEIRAAYKVALDVVSHPTRGAWIEIPPYSLPSLKITRRTPHGVRGLKSHLAASNHRGRKSHPTRGAWIEIQAHQTCR